MYLLMDFLWARKVGRGKGRRKCASVASCATRQTRAFFQSFCVSANFCIVVFNDTHYIERVQYNVCQ